MSEMTLEEKEEIIAEGKARAAELLAKAEEAKNKEVEYPKPHLNSEFRKIIKVMTLAELSLSRTASIRNGRCVLFFDGKDTGDSTYFMKGKWINQTGRDPTSNMVRQSSINDSGHYACLDVINYRRYVSTFWQVGILDLEALAKEPRQRQYKVDELLSGTLLALGRVAPTNPTFRAHLSALFGSAPPPELMTWPAVEEWMELQEPPDVRGVSHLLQYAISSNPIRTQIRYAYAPVQPENEPAPATPPPGLDNPVALIAEATYRCRSSGHCRYSVEQADDEVRHSITAHWLRDMIRDGCSMGEIMQGIESEVIHHANTDLVDVGDTDYSDYDSDDTTNERYELRDSVRRELTSWIRRQYGEEAEAILQRGT